MASGRLAFALVCAGALLWVYCLSSLAAVPARKILPRQGKSLVLVFLASFAGSLYLLALWFANPILAMENFFIISLVPLMCAGSGIFERIDSMNLQEALLRSLGEALVLGGLIITFSLIREPLAYLSLSLPGGSLGIVKLFSAGTKNFLPIRFVTASAGALLLLGYGIGIYRYFRGQYGPPGDREENP
jgi:hypothetical protein